MQVTTLTVHLIADTEAQLRRAIAEIEQLPGSKIDPEYEIESATLDDEDAILGTHFAAAARCMDALHRVAKPLLIEIAKEVRDAPYAAKANGYTDVDLKAHISDMFTDKVCDALDAEFPDVTDEQHVAAMDAVLQWAFGDTAMEDVRLSEEDCAEIRKAWCRYFDDDITKYRNETNAHWFCYAGPLQQDIPRLFCMADSIYSWIYESMQMGAWQPVEKG